MKQMKSKIALVILAAAIAMAGAGIYFAVKRPGNNGAGARSAPKASGERKIKYYKSTMMPGEISQTPRKDSMGMDMVPVYEDEADDAATIAIDPVTIQNMGIRTGTVTRGPLRRSHAHRRRD